MTLVTGVSGLDSDANKNGNLLDFSSERCHYDDADAWCEWPFSVNVGK